MTTTMINGYPLEEIEGRKPTQETLMNLYKMLLPTREEYLIEFWEPENKDWIVQEKLREATGVFPKTYDPTPLVLQDIRRSEKMGEEQKYVPDIK